MTQYVQEKVERLEQPITAWMLLGVIIVLTLAYAGFINATISNIVSSRDIQSQTGALTSSVSNLESNYLAAQSKITLESALAMGYTQPRDGATYVSRLNTGALSFNR